MYGDMAILRPVSGVVRYHVTGVRVPEQAREQLKTAVSPVRTD